MKDKFIEIYEGNIKREGAENLLKWLKGTDFFVAPASTRFHGSHEGGLVEHSVNVYNRLKRIMEITDAKASEETIAIISLLHDLCKVNFYKVDTRNVKKDGVWTQVPYYTVDDQLCYGHGEGSVYIISGFMRLTREEALAINHHMGGFDERVRGGSYALSGAWEKHPIGMLLHCADLQATYMDEVRRND